MVNVSGSSSGSMALRIMLVVESSSTFTTLSIATGGRLTFLTISATWDLETVPTLSVAVNTSVYWPASEKPGESFRMKAAGLGELPLTTEANGAPSTLTSTVCPTSGSLTEILESSVLPSSTRRFDGPRMTGG